MKDLIIFKCLTMEPINKQTNFSETTSQTTQEVLKSGTAKNIIRKVEKNMKTFDLMKKKKAAQTLEEMKKKYVTH